jgi:hypothetical protein
MSSVEFSIPADLTGARFRRVNPSMNEGTARELAAELQDIIVCVQRHCAAQPRPYLAFEESDVIQTLVRTVVDFSTSDSRRSELCFEREISIAFTRSCRVDGASPCLRSSL